jgi:DNA polymerase III subunit epsilon
MSKFVAIDFETANRSRESACSIGIVHVENFQIIKREHHLIQPPNSAFEFTYIHGIRWKDVAKAPNFGVLWPQIEAAIQGSEFIAAHNASFDQGVLHACCDIYGIERPKHKFVCTVQLARKTWKLHPTKLPDVCDYLGLKLTHHHALSDAQACAQIVIAATQPKENTPPQD